MILSKDSSANFAKLVQHRILLTVPAVLSSVNQGGKKSNRCKRDVTADTSLFSLFSVNSKVLVIIYVCNEKPGLCVIVEIHWDRNLSYPFVLQK